MSIFKKLFKKNKTPNNEFRTLPVAQVIRETDKAVTLVFDKPEEGFDFTSGQYLTLKATIDGQEVRRAYSLCNLPSENVLKVTVKETPDGFFSKYVNTMVSVGDLFDILPPQGKFIFQDIEKANRHVIGFAGGSGITPIFSILKSVLYNEPNSRFTLFYGNRTQSDIIFLDELKSLKSQFNERLKIVHVLSDEETDFSPYHGFIDAEKVAMFAKSYFNQNDVNLFYLCGPGQMTAVIAESLHQLGIERNSVKTELFTAPIPQIDKKSDTKNTLVAKDAKVTIVYGGKNQILTYSDDSKTLLDLALDNNVKVPFSCLNGVCSSCSCKVTDGEVHMAQNFTLEKEEIADGYVLSCQSKPITQTVTLNFDDNRI